MAGGITGYRAILGKPGQGGIFLNHRIGITGMARNPAPSFTPLCVGPA